MRISPFGATFGWRIILPILLACCLSLYGQEKKSTKPPLRPFVPPVERHYTEKDLEEAKALALQLKLGFTPLASYPLKDVLVAKDEGCAKDMAKSIKLDGIAQRKALAELLSYGCARVVKDDVARITDAKKIEEVMMVLMHFLGDGSDGWVFMTSIPRN